MEQGTKSSNSFHTEPVLCSRDYGETDSSNSESENSREQTSLGVVHVSCADVQQEVNKNNSSLCEATAERRSPSPDLSCPICLGQLENRSYTDTCFHKFCFVCLVEWSKVRAVCPLCKQPFTSVIHNVRSYNDFEQFPVSSPARTSLNSESSRTRFRYRTTMVESIASRQIREQESLQRPSRYRHRGISQFNVPAAFTSGFRRAIYRDELWVQSVSGVNRYREISAEFFARNPACTHRLTPWLNRELMALLRNVDDVEFMLNIILESVRRINIDSEAFHALVSPFLGGRTRHFMHEFNTFARSPFELAAYDARAVYSRLPENETTSGALTVASSSSSESPSDSETDLVEVYNSIRPTSTARPARERVTPAIRSAEGIDRMSSVGRSDIYSGAPSSASGSQLNALGTNCRQSVNSENVDDDADEQVVITSFDKPWRERSPILLSSDDTGSEELGNACTNLATNSTVTSNSDGPKPSSKEALVEKIEKGNKDAESQRVSSSSEAVCSRKTTSNENLLAKPNVSMSVRHKQHKRKGRHSVSLDIESCKDVLGEGSREKKISDDIRRHRHHRSRRHRHRRDKSNNTGYTTSQSCDGCSFERHAMWLSDDSDEEDDCDFVHQSQSRIRSAIVVPSTQFKKHSTGHKN